MLFLLKKIYIIQFLYFQKINHGSFKVSSVHIFKAFWSCSSSIFLLSFSIISFSQVFSALSIFSTISSSAQVNSAQAKIHLQLTALASTMKSVTTEILSNNFPCISTFHCERLKIIAFPYRGVIPNTIDLLFEYLALPFQYHSVISFPQTFSAFLLGVCVAFCLIHYMFNIPTNWEKEFVFEPFCPREMGMVTNSRTIPF